MRAALACVLALALAAPSAAAEEKQTPERAYAEALRIAGEQPELGAELLAEFMRKHARHPLADDVWYNALPAQMEIVPAIDYAPSVVKPDF